jgi:hypothetical protein
MDTQTLESIRRTLITRSQSLTAHEGRTGLETLGRTNWGFSPAMEFAGVFGQGPVTAPPPLLGSESPLFRIQETLARIDQDTFGDCVVCHGAIETERLRAIPDVARCGGCTH